LKVHYTLGVNVGNSIITKKRRGLRLHVVISA